MDMSSIHKLTDEEIDERLGKKNSNDERYRLDLYKTLHEKWGVPERIIRNLKKLRDTRAVQIANDFCNAKPEGWCLILSADKGTGKSTAAASWLMGRMEQVHIETTIKQIGRWWTGTRLARVSAYGPEFEKICSLPVMVIDDLGVEYLDKNGNFLQKLDELVDERYSNFRKTIITTNLNAEHFRDRYGERVADRIREGFNDGGAFVELSEASMRTRPK
jgi:DNA replication protein DnaC